MSSLYFISTVSTTAGKCAQLFSYQSSPTFIFGESHSRILISIGKWAVPVEAGLCIKAGKAIFPSSIYAPWEEQRCLQFPFILCRLLEHIYESASITSVPRKEWWMFYDDKPLPGTLQFWLKAIAACTFRRASKACWLKGGLKEVSGGSWEKEHLWLNQDTSSFGWSVLKQPLKAPSQLCLCPLQDWSCCSWGRHPSPGGYTVMVSDLRLSSGPGCAQAGASAGLGVTAGPPQQQLGDHLALSGLLFHI